MELASRRGRLDTANALRVAGEDRGSMMEDGGEHSGVSSAPKSWSGP
jgi:hypothetical protein